MSASDPDTTVAWRVFDALGFIALLVGVEQIVGWLVDLPHSSLVVGVVLFILGPVFYWWTGGWSRFGKRLGRLLRRLIRFDDLERQIVTLQTKVNDLSVTVSLIESALPAKNTALQPTVEMLEESRRQLMAKREHLIAKWRDMVGDIHKTLVSSEEPMSATAILERHPDFLTYRPLMSDHTRSAIYGTTMVVPPDQSTMNGSLHCILRDIEGIEKMWGII